MKNEKNQNVLDELQDVIDTMEQQVKKLPELFMDVCAMGMGLDGDDPMNSRDIADELRGEYIDLTPDLVEEAQRDASEMTNLLSKAKNIFPEKLMVDMELSGIGKSCTWSFLDDLRISESAQDEQGLEAALSSEFDKQEFVRMPKIRELYDYRGFADRFHDESLRPTAREFQKLKEIARKVARKLEEMGKTLLPDIKGKRSVLDMALEYCYLGEGFAKSIAAQSLFYSGNAVRIHKEGSAIRTIQGMYDKTDENGTLFLPEWSTDPDIPDTGRFYKCQMVWDELDLERTIRDFQELYTSLLELGEEIQNTKTEQEEYFTNLEKSLKNDLVAKHLILRARRFCHLVTIGAPSVILWGEATYLAQAFALNACGKSLELVN
ncbi:MAG: hypothetical protein IKO41_05880 [Lachnospiraceae bacterium]|nr:hypothetical protein [Lachnospiraceae bacterium]